MDSYALNTPKTAVFHSNVFEADSYRDGSEASEYGSTNGDLQNVSQLTDISVDFGYGDEDNWEDRSLLPENSKLRSSDDPEDGDESIVPGVKPRAMPQFFIITAAQFSGYATLFGLQSFLRAQVGADSSKLLEDLFGIFVSFLFIGNLVFRIGHNFLFMPVPPYYRVVIAIVAMLLSTMVNTFAFVFPAGKAPLPLVCVSYALGGVGIGTFEATIMSVSTPFGKTAKYWTVQGIPIGVNTITVVGFLILGVFPHPECIYMFASAVLILALVVYVTTIPYIHNPGDESNARLLLSAAKEWHRWVPQISVNAVAMAINMCTVTLFCPAAVSYIYPPKSTVHFSVLPFLDMPQGTYLSIYSLGVFLGDTVSRRATYSLKGVNPLLFLMLNAVGILLVLSSIPELVVFAGFLIMFGNGSIYATSSRRIDDTVGLKYNLMAFSGWLFIGDFGSVLGSWIVQPVCQAIQWALRK